MDVKTYIAHLVGSNTLRLGLSQAAEAIRQARCGAVAGSRSRT